MKYYINHFALSSLLLTICLSLEGQSPLPSVSQDSRAVIVVTGMTVKTGNRGEEVRNNAVAAEAVVRLTDAGGRIREKTTRPFPLPGDRENEIYCFADFSLYSEQKDVVDRMKNGEIFYTADFGIDLDSTYQINVRFRNEKEISVRDYRIPGSWRTHFYYHWTNGLKSPASVLRVEKDPGSDLKCFIYALFPLDSYKKFGGNQVDR